MADPDAADLAAFAARRDERAFAAVVERHAALVVGTCARVIGDADAAADAAQAVFVTLAAKAGRVAAHPCIAGWLHRVALHVARRSRDAEAARRARERAAAEAAAMDARAAAERDRLRRSLDEALARLPERYRLPIVLHHLDGLEPAEVGERLGLRPSALSMRLARGRELLRRALGGDRRGVGAAVVAALLAPAPLGGWSAAHAAAAATGVGSASALALSRAALRALAIAKAKAVALVVVAVAAVGGGAVAAKRAIARAPAPATFAFDFEDGARPALLSEGDVVPGPPRAGNRFAVAAIALENARGERRYEAGFARAHDALGAYRGDLVVSFRCWYASRAGTVYLSAWDATAKRDYGLRVDRVPQRAWTRVEARLADLHPDDGGAGALAAGDLLGDLLVAIEPGADAALFIDDVELRAR